MVPVIVAVVLALSMLGFVLYPLYRERAGRSQPSVSEAMPPAHEEVEQPKSADEQAQDARTALREIELDYQLGNISEEDYRSMRERYVRSALVALKSRYEREQELDEVIEEQLRDLKEKHENNDA